MIDQVAYLIQQTFVTNDVGDSIPIETSRRVFVGVRSIGLKRKLEAEAYGLKLELKFILSDRAEYQAEEIIEYNGIRYNIVDVYIPSDNTVELTVKRF